MGTSKTVYDEDYILTRVTITETGCWEWNRYRDKDGYGQANSRLGRNGMAHRLSYTIFKGPIPEGKLVRHSYDNPPCCNPEHLIAGTYRENLYDAVERGRIDLEARSELGNSVLRIDQATREAVLCYAATIGGTQSEIGEIFGISRSSVANILNLQQD